MNTTYDKEADPVLSREDAIAILNTPDDQLQELIDRASALRHKYKGNRVSIHILTNARSGNCSQDCAYCAQSCEQFPLRALVRIWMLTRFPLYL